MSSFDVRRLALFAPSSIFASVAPSSFSSQEPNRNRGADSGGSSSSSAGDPERRSDHGVLARCPPVDDPPHASRRSGGSPPPGGKPGGGGGAGAADRDQEQQQQQQPAPEGPGVRLQGLPPRRGREEARGAGPPGPHGPPRRIGRKWREVRGEQPSRRRAGVRLPGRVRVRAQPARRRTHRQRREGPAGGPPGAGDRGGGLVDGGCGCLRRGATDDDRCFLGPLRGGGGNGASGTGSLSARGSISRAGIKAKGGTLLWKRWSRCWDIVVLWSMMVVLSMRISEGAAFTPPSCVAAPPPEPFLAASFVGARGGTVVRKRGRRSGRFGRMWAPPEAQPEGHDEDGGGSTGDGAFGDAHVWMDDLSWRVEKLRLEERNTRQFLRSGPRFLPYEECRKWVQAWGNRWKTEDDWRQWIAMGEKRNPYIPSRPDEYYAGGGQWVSWEHFLGVAVPPPERADAREDSTSTEEGGNDG